jgi:hypothetical protein
MGRNFHPDFRPDLTPKEMLELGVFCGKYMSDARKEFPASWFTRAKLSPHSRDCSLNYLLFLAWMPVNHCQCGAKRVGFIPTIRADSVFSDRYSRRRAIMGRQTTAERLF